MFFKKFLKMFNGEKVKLVMITAALVSFFVVNSVQASELVINPVKKTINKGACSYPVIPMPKDFEQRLQQSWSLLLDSMSESDKKMIQDTVTAIYIVDMGAIKNVTTDFSNIVLDLTWQDAPNEALAVAMAHELAKFMINNDGKTYNPTDLKAAADDLTAALLKNAGFKEQDIFYNKRFIREYELIDNCTTPITIESKGNWSRATNDGDISMPSLEENLTNQNNENNQTSIASETTNQLTTTILTTTPKLVPEGKSQLVEIPFEQTFSGPYERTSLSYPNNTATYASTEPGKGIRTGPPEVSPGEFTAEYIIVATLTDPSLVFNSSSLGTLTVNIEGTMRGVYGRPITIMGKATAKLSTDPSAPDANFQFEGPVKVFPDGRMEFDANNISIKSNDIDVGKVTGSWEQTTAK